MVSTGQGRVTGKTFSKVGGKIRGFDFESEKTDILKRVREMKRYNTASLKTGRNVSG